MIIFGTLALVICIYCTCKEPGYLKKPSIPFLTLLDRFDPTMLCPDCEIIRTPRSRHCSICNKCVERYDHHCPWINNCVGIRNHFSFLSFLLIIELNLVFIIILCSVNMVKFTKPVDQINQDFFLIKLGS